MVMDVLLEQRDTIHVVISAMFLLCCLPAKAAAPEWMLSAILFCVAGGNELFEAGAGGPVIWREANVGHLAVDLLALLGMLVVALHANRMYPLWIAAAQIVTLAGHSFRLGLHDISAFAYAVMAVFPSYVQLMAMALGLARHAVRRCSIGVYPSWRPTSRHRDASLDLTHAPKW